MATRTTWGFASVCLVTLGLFGACGGSLGGSSGGESHFLIECDDSCGGGLSCIAGVCTRGCVIDEDSCEDLHADAECTDESIEPGQVAVCDLACTEDEQCESLGGNYFCDGGQCRGATSGSSSGSGGASSSGGTGGTTSSGGPTNGGGGAGDSCEVLFQEYPDGASFNHPARCEACTCTAGELTCVPYEDGPCEVGVPVFPCTTDNPGDPVEVKSAFIQSDSLRLEVAYGGGCETHDFGVCYEPELDASGVPEDPVIGQLRLVHDSHDDPCEAYPSSTLHFNLRPYAQYVTETLEVPGAVVDTTSFGVYAFGELGCEQGASAAAAQVAEAAEQTLGFGCSADTDCVWVTTELPCFSDCGRMVASGGADHFATSVEQVRTRLCEPYEANGCPSVASPDCEMAPELGCVEGRCVQF